MKSFKEQILELSGLANQYKQDGVLNSEEQVKQSIIVKFIAILGFDRGNPYEVEYEKPIHNKLQDCVISVNDTKIIIECKKFGFKLNDTVRKQLAEYFDLNEAENKIGIATNGDEFKFYESSDIDGKMSKNACYIFRLLSPSEEDFKELQKYTKQYIQNTNPKQEKAYSKFERSCREFFESLRCGDISSELIHCLKIEAGINRKEFESLIDNKRLEEIAQQQLKNAFEIIDTSEEGNPDGNTEENIEGQWESFDFDFNIPAKSSLLSTPSTPSTSILSNDMEHYFKDYPFKTYNGCKFKHFKYRGQMLEHYSMRQLLLYIIESVFKENPNKRNKLLSEFEAGSYKIVTGKVTGEREKEYSYISSQNISVKTKLGAESMFRFIQKIFDILDIDYTDLVICIEATDYNRRKARKQNNTFQFEDLEIE